MFLQASVILFRRGHWGEGWSNMDWSPVSLHCTMDCWPAPPLHHELLNHPYPLTRNCWPTPSPRSVDTPSPTYPLPPLPSKASLEWSQGRRGYGRYCLEILIGGCLVEKKSSEISLWWITRTIKYFTFCRINVNSRFFCQILQRAYISSLH